MKEKRYDFVYVKPNVLKDIMKENQVTVKDIKELTETKNVSAVYHWLSGSTRVSPSKLDAVCAYLGVYPEDVIDRDRNENTPSKLPRAGQRQPGSGNKKKSVSEIPIVVTMEPPKETVDIPENAEVMFAHNVKYYIYKTGMTEDQFFEKIGIECEDFLDQVIKHSFKIPLHMLIKISKELGVSIEDLTLNDKTIDAMDEIFKLEQQLKGLKTRLGLSEIIA